MQKYLEFSDGKSHKFWSITTADNTYTVVFGKIGTAGQTQSKAFGSAAEAEEQAEKQALAKIKKGYAEAVPPADLVVTAIEPKTAKAKAKTEEPVEGPEPVTDDGLLKPWHAEEFWEYSWYCPDEERFADLATPENLDGDSEDKPAAVVKIEPVAEKIWYYWGEGRYEDAEGNDADDDDEDEEDADDFVRACKRGQLEKARKILAVLQTAGCDPAKLQKTLDKSVTGILRDYEIEAEQEDVMQWLLEQGAKPGDKSHCKTRYAKRFCKAYAGCDEPGKVKSLFAEICDKTFAKLAPAFLEDIRLTLQCLREGKAPEDSGVRKIVAEGLPENCIGFRIFSSREDFGLDALIRNDSAKTLFRKEYEKSDGIPGETAGPYVAKYMRPLIPQLLAEGAFERLDLPMLSVKVYKYEEPIFEQVLRPDLLEAQQAVFLAELERLETESVNQANIEALKEVIPVLLEGPLSLDVERASRLIGKYLYSLNNEAEKAANELLCHYDTDFAQLQHDRALYLHANGDFYAAHNVMGWAAGRGYAPAAERLKEFEALAAERAKLVPKEGGDVKKKKVDQYAKGSVKVRNFKAIFNENDLFCETENIIARAYYHGSIYIRFKIEGEGGYSEALDFLNNLLEKGYASFNGGFVLLVRFLIEPTFIKKLAFPHTSCHAFFARAVQYESLREKVKRYAELALVEFDWYKDLDGEDNTVPGTFAACALALCDEQYIELAGLYGRESDDEHQYIQLEVPPALYDKYGAIPAVAKATFDISASNGQDGELPINKAFYTRPENLAAIMEHCDSGIYEQRSLEWHVPQYVESMLSENVKSNLRKLKKLADEAKSPEDRNVFVDFYNFYKGYAAMRDEEDYGEDLTGAAENPAEIVVPQYHEDPPGVMSMEEAKKHLGDFELSWVEEAGQKYSIMFGPAAIVNPYHAEYVAQQRKALGKIWNKAPSGIVWGQATFGMGKWVVCTKGFAYDYGVIMFDGKNKPWLMYGMFNHVPLFSRFHKRPFKTAEEAEAARQSCLTGEAPPKVILTDDQRKLDAIFDEARTAIENDRMYTASVLLRKFKPEDGLFYDAALRLLAQVEAKFVNFAAQKAIYEELLQRQPEFADYWNKELQQING